MSCARGVMGTDPPKLGNKAQLTVTWKDPESPRDAGGGVELKPMGCHPAQCHSPGTDLTRKTHGHMPSVFLVSAAFYRGSWSAPISKHPPPRSPSLKSSTIYFPPL